MPTRTLNGDVPVGTTTDEVLGRWKGQVEKVLADRPDVGARGKRAVTAETALRLARYFGTSPDLWMGLQAHYELERAQHMLGDRVVAEVRPRAA